MNALAITVFVGVILAGLFVALFVSFVLRDGGGSERDALLPLEDERPTKGRR